MSDDRENISPLLSRLQQLLHEQPEPNCRILELLLTGHTHEEIAAKLGINAKKVQRFLQSLKDGEIDQMREILEKSEDCAEVVPSDGSKNRAMLRGYEGVGRKVRANLEFLAASREFVELPPMEVYLDPGEASAQTIQAVLEALSDLHRAAGGLGLEFTSDGNFVLASREVSK